MSQQFNPPPGWPVPQGWTPPQGWEPDPSWPPAPAGWQFWAEDAAEQSAGSSAETQCPPAMVNLSELPPPQPASAAGKRLVILGTVGAVLLVVLAGAVVLFLHGRGDVAAPSNARGGDRQPTESWKTLPSTAPPAVSTVLPAGAVVCGVRPGGKYQGAARGTETTSCPFVENVRDALNNAGGQVPSVVGAYSPVTGLHYQMSCAMEQVVTCRGGKNAVVYVYEEHTAAAAAPVAPVSSPFPSDAAVFEALPRDEKSRYEIINRIGPTPGWYVVEMHLIGVQIENAWVILRDNDPPNGHLVWVAGPGTSFPNVSVPEAVRQAMVS